MTAKKYIINTDRPALSSQEIEKLRDFDALMARYNEAPKPVYRKVWIRTLSIAAAVLLLAGAIIGYKFYSDRATGEGTAVNTPAKAFIAPPLPHLQIAYTTWQVDAEKGAEFTYKTGSKIRIPKNAFVDAQGNPIKGPVEICYREFHNPVEFFLSGIPMHYDSAGTHYQFESAGMVDISGFQYDKPVYLASKEVSGIDIEMASRQSGNRFNLYFLDTVKKEWIVLGKDKVMNAEKEKRPEVARDTVSQEKMVFDRNPEQVLMPDTGKTVRKLALHTPKPVKPVEPRKLNPMHQRFNLNVNPAEFPELAGYKNVIFEVSEENKNFTTDYYKIMWDAVKLDEADARKGTYWLTMYSSKVKESPVKLLVYPAYQPMDYDNAMTEYKKKYDDYKKKLASREEEEKRLKEQAEELRKKQEQQIAKDQKKWEDQQKKMEEQQKKQFASYDLSNKTIRAFQIAHFGVYNCDCPVMYPKGRTVQVAFEDNKGNSLSPANIYLAEMGRNAAFSYFDPKLGGYDAQKSFNNFSFNPAAKNLIWFVTPEAKLAVFRPEQFAGLPADGSKLTLQVELSEREFKTQEELSDWLGIGKETVLQ